MSGCKDLQTRRWAIPTINQLVRKGRKKKKRQSHALEMGGKPQIRGVVQKVYVVKPVKPNSAERFCARVKLINVESEGELRRLSRIASDAAVLAPVALRINPEVTVETPPRYTRTGGRGD